MRRGDRAVKPHFGRLWIATLALWLIGVAVVLAQQPTGDPPLTIVKHALPDPVSAGAELTYRLTITHTGESLLTGVIVTDTVPVYTTFVMASGRESDWLIQTPRAGGEGEIIWRHVSPLAPGSVSHLRFVVRTDPGNAEPIVSPGYHLTVEGWDAVFGEPMTTRVLPSAQTPAPELAPPTSPPDRSTEPIPSQTMPLLPTPTTAPSTPTPLADVAPQPSGGPLFGLARWWIGLLIVSAAPIFFLARLVKKRRTSR